VGPFNGWMDCKRSKSDDGLSLYLYTPDDASYLKLFEIGWDAGCDQTPCKEKRTKFTFKLLDADTSLIGLLLSIDANPVEFMPKEFTLAAYEALVKQAKKEHLDLPTLEAEIKELVAEQAQELKRSPKTAAKELKAAIKDAADDLKTSLKDAAHNFKSALKTAKTDLKDTLAANKCGGVDKDCVKDCRKDSFSCMRDAGRDRSDLKECAKEAVSCVKECRPSRDALKGCLSNIKDFKNDYKKEMKEAKADDKRDIAEAKKEYADAVAKLKAEATSGLTRLKERHAKAIAALRSQFGKKVEERAAELKTALRLLKLRRDITQVTRAKLLKQRAKTAN
jgi:F0F1-type ATP synthase membrane subunit b/b'